MSGGTTLYLHVPDDLHRWLKERAEAEDRTLNNLAVRLLKQARNAEQA